MTFIPGTDPLPAVKVTLNPIPSGGSIANYHRSGDFNAIRQALLDIRAYLLGGIGGIHNVWSGSGEDGAQHFDGTTTILGVAPATVDGVANTYHFTRDLHLDDGTVIDTGVSIWCENVRFHCRGTCTNNGHIHNNGRPATGRSGASTSGTHTFAGGSNGSGGSGSNAAGAGGAGDASATAYEGWTAEIACPPGNVGSGIGQGGGGGKGDVSDDGGTGGAITLGTGTTRLDIYALYTGRTGAAFANTSYTTGSGGGGGGSTGFASQGGGGGAGGCQGFFGFDIIAGANGRISCDGGNGFHGVAAATPNNTPCGGGGGGGGGIIGVVYLTNIGPNAITANGGVGGAADQGGSSGALAGGNGSAGTVRKFNLSHDGT